MSRLDWCQNVLLKHPCYDWKNDNCDGCNIFQAYCEGAARAKKTERTGEWVSLFDGNEWFIHCSKCKTQHYEEDLLMGGSELPDYCPNCGADMRGDKE